MKTSRVKILALVLLAASAARADGLPCDKTCSVNRNCSSTGVACAPDDRECTGGAAAKGLEVKCEQSCDTGKVFVYCPPDTGRSDSGFVWILLVIAGVLAVGGGAVSFAVLRKKT